ncbi:MAG TPA: HAMP domain-containing sensor histidine kinase [Thermoleophilaceae bacterium]|nr:HAMP domain-containing sensor histidine kinase [Thermoleophilaceae bacterium]
MSARDPGVVHRMRLRIPVRLKLAIVSAGLTFAILLLFALVVGTFTEQKLRSEFNSELRATAADLQESIRVERDEDDGSLRPGVPPALLNFAASGGASVRVVDAQDNRTIGAKGPAVDLGTPFEGVRDVGAYRVVARPLFLGSLDRTGSFDLRPGAGRLDGTVAYVQYARPRAKLETTTARVRLFLALGVIGGTLLAFLAGLAVARRAMRPIADLTKAAREVARTRDPAMTLPKPHANDEVADLADTLEHMLRELDAARGETEAALDRQRNFVADASHELRTPLTSILANLELLEAELARPGGPRQADSAADIAGSALRSSKRMRRLVGDLLLLARADAGRQAARGPVDLSKVVCDAAGEAAALAEGHAVSLDLPAGEEPPTVNGVPDDLHRLVLNLLENALIHTPPGTPVVASVLRVDGAVRLEVADRGPGVPRELRDRIFERFARPPGQSARPKGSSGLGLAIVRAVAAAHAGTVEVLDAEGGGALFRVTIPAEEAVRSARGGVRDSVGEPVTDLKGADTT